MERKEAIEVIKKNWPDSSFTRLREALETLIPELKDEDEKIRKALMQNLKERFGTEGNMGEGLDMPDVLAWFEKQGQVKESLISQHENKICKESDDSLTSEDERIRNYILSHLQQHLKTVREFLNNGMSAPFSSEEIKMLEASVAWLEKQKPSDLPHWQKSNLPNNNTTGFNSDYFCHKGYCINYKELFEKLPKDD